MEKRRRVLSIQSHVVHGYVGNKSATFPLQLLGFDVDPINSVQFSNHTGYPSFKGQRLNGDQLWELIEGVEANKLINYTHLLTGYIGSVSFLETILKVIKKLREHNPNLVYVCDPVMGDIYENGRETLYVPQELVKIFKEVVITMADIITPNQYEAELLTGIKITNLEDAIKACDIMHSKGPKSVVITSMICENVNKITVLGSHKHNDIVKRFTITVPRLVGYYSGLGDLVAALLLAWSEFHPDDLRIVVEKTISSVQAVIKRTERAGEREILLIQSKNDIEHPPTFDFIEVKDL